MKVYDAFGNITSFYNGVESHTYTYETGNWKDRLSKVDGVSITYDGIGNPIKYYNGKSYSFTWTEGRRLAAVGSTWKYMYDADGLRIKKQHAINLSTEYLIADGVTIGERYCNPNGRLIYALRYIFDENGSVCGYMASEDEENWTEYYFIRNLQGDVLKVIRESDGAVVAEYTYDSWGNILSATGECASENPFRYRGYYYDSETGFYYLGSRYYDPALGRFINADGEISGIGGDVLGYNLYAYCMNNPINMLDETGHWPQWFKDVGNWVKKVSDVVENVAEDIKNFKINNQSEEVTLESNYISAYKGKIVIRTDFERSGSFGILFISRLASERSNAEDEVRHEYGHTMQLAQLGMLKYTLCIFIPSMFEWGSDPIYYRRPWEITADIYGGVQSRYYSEYEKAGFDYLKISRRWGPLVWLTIN